MLSTITCAAHGAKMLEGMLVALEHRAQSLVRERLKSVRRE